MKITGQVSDEHGRALRNVFEVSLTDLVSEVTTGVFDPSDLVIVEDSVTNEVFKITASSFVAGAGSITGGANVGTGAGVFKDVLGNDLRFRSIVAGSNVTVTPGADDITITVPVIGATSHSALTNLAWSVAGHTIDTDFLPDSASARDLGSTSLPWNSLFLSGLASDSASVASSVSSGTGNSPKVLLTGKVTSSPNIDAYLRVEWKPTLERVALSTGGPTGGQFNLDAEIAFAASSTDQYIEVKPSLVPTATSTYNLGINSGTLARFWQHLFLSGNLDDGTNQVTIADINRKSTLTTNGDLYTRTAGAVTRLGVGSAGDVLTVVAGLPAWQAPAATYTDENAQDAVGGILTDTASVDFTYNDAGNTISAAVLPAGVDHGGLGGLGDDDHTIYLLADGTRALTGNWAAGAFQISAKNFLTASTGLTTLASVKAAQTVSAAANDFGSPVYRGLQAALTHDVTAAALVTPSLIALDLSVALSKTSGTYLTTTFQLIKATLTNVSGAPYNPASGSQPVYVNVADTGATAFANGAFEFSLSSNSAAGNSIALRSISIVTSNANAIAYQGYAQGAAGTTGALVGVEGFIAGATSAAARLTAVSGLPRGSGATFPTSDKVMAFRGASGHWLASIGSLFITSTSRTDPSVTTTTHLTPASVNGEGYFEGLLEVDGVVFADGGLTLADAKDIVVGTGTGTKIGTATTQKIGLWNVAPVAQYATTGTLTGFTANTTTPVLDGSTFTGNTGATAYTIGDIVRALKLCGIMAA